MATTPKLERLLDLIAELLHAERPLAADELHHRIPGYPEDKDSFKRAFERDKNDLREMDIPLRIETVPGRVPVVDGYRIDQAEYGLPDPGLEPDELAAVHLAATALRLEGADVHAGLDKLGGAPGAEARERGATSPLIPAAPQLAEVFEAVGQHRQLRFRYRDKDRVVDPVRLHHQRGHWYLHAHDHGSGERRSFRLDRIDGPVEPGEKGSAEIVDLDDADPMRLDSWSIGEDDPVEAEVLVRAPQAGLAARTVGPDVTRRWLDDGSVVLELTVRRRDGLRSFVLGFLDDAELLGPPELRDDLVDWLESMAGSTT